MRADLKCGEQVANLIYFVIDDAQDGDVLLQGVLHNIRSLGIVNQVNNVVGSDWQQLLRKSEFHFEISSPSKLRT